MENYNQNDAALNSAISLNGDVPKALEFEKIILENTDLLVFLSSKTTLKDAEKEKRIDDFLAEKFYTCANCYFFNGFRSF